MLVFFLLSLLSILTTTRGNAVKELDKKCKPSETCTPLSSCPSSAKDVKELIRKTKETKDYKQLSKTMKQMVCNSREKAVCCQPEEGKNTGDSDFLSLFH